MPYTKEQIKERYDKLPADIKQAMDSVDTTNAVVDIGEKHDLMYDQISDLVDEVGLVMIGLTPSAMFVSNISRRMQVDIGKAMLIAQDINKEIFDRMRDSLRKIEDAHGESEYNESENIGSEKLETEQDLNIKTGDETVMTEVEKAQQKSVIAAVEQAGGFVIDKPDQPPFIAEEMVHDAIAKNIDSKKDSINILEKNIPLEQKIEAPSQSKAAVPLKQKIETPLAPDHLLGDTPESVQTTSKETTMTAATPKNLDQTSIVDTLLSKGVAMPMDSDVPKPENKKRPYDGTDPYREPIE